MVKIPETPWEEKKVDLKGLSLEKRIDMQATPSAASVKFNMDEDINGEVAKWFDKYNELPINIKLGLGSSEVRQKIKELASKINLMNEGSLGELSRIVRDVYVGLIKGKDIKKRLVSVLKIEEKMVADVMKDIAVIVALVKDIGNKKSDEYFEKLSLKDALEKYAGIGEQEVTTGMIVDKKTGKYINPTVQNWIDDYINQFGSGEHTSLERGKYLDDSANTKNLEKQDKKKIGKLTKSYDEGNKLIIDREEKVILWNLHDNENQLGINSDRNKRVINKFKIEEAQTTGITESVKSIKSKVKTEHTPVKGYKAESQRPAVAELGEIGSSQNKSKNINKSGVKNSLENKGSDSIMNNREKDKNKIDKNTERRDDGILNLSSEIEQLR